MFHVEHYLTESHLTIDGYRPSRVETLRLKQVEVSETVDGTDIVDHSEDKWAPTAQQESFLEHLFDDPDCKLSLYHAIHAADGTMQLLNQWCRQQPPFLFHLKDLVSERFALSEVGADLTVAASADGDMEPSKHQRWGVEQIGKIREFLNRKEMRFIQINQQINIGVNADMTDESLEKVISDAGNIATKTASRAIEG